MHLIVDKSSDKKVLLTCHHLMEVWGCGGVDVVVIEVDVLVLVLLNIVIE